MEMQNQPPLPPEPPVEPPMEPPVQPPRRRRSVMGPAILIALGIIFLLSNLGLLTWNIWEMLWRLWPLWLVAAGLDLLIGRRGAWGAWIAVGITLGVIGFTGWFVQQSWGSLSGEAAPLQQFSQADQGARRADVTIHGSVGRLTVRATDTNGILAEGNIQPLRNEQVTNSFSLSGDTARFTLESRSNRSGPMFPGRESPRWDVALSDRIPMTLQISTGVGQSAIDLGQIQVTDLQMNTGVGETTLTLPQSGQIRARVETGVGSVNIRIPGGMAARIRASRGVGSININGDFRRQGDTWISPGYDGAQNRVDLEVHGGVGSIDINTR
jgi:hypothetical protein